jgi:hypothetical protein
VNVPVGIDVVVGDVSLPVPAMSVRAPHAANGMKGPKATRAAAMIRMRRSPEHVSVRLSLA